LDFKTFSFDSHSHNMATPDVQPTPFPASSKTSSGLVNDITTEVTCTSFSDKIFLTISQAGKLAHWVHVPLATTTTDPMNPGMFHNHDSSNELLPMTHLTATTVLGGTKRDDEMVGQTLATTIGSAILMKRPQEERMLVLGLGLNGAANMGRTEFDAVVGLVFECL
jgi:proteasome assembly chaperone 3